MLLLLEPRCPIEGPRLALRTFFERLGCIIGFLEFLGPAKSEALLYPQSFWSGIRCTAEPEDDG